MQFRRTTVGLHLLATGLPGCDWYSWHPCSLQDILHPPAKGTIFFCMQTAWVRSTAEHQGSGPSSDCPKCSGIGAFPSLVTSAGPQEHLEFLSLCLSPVMETWALPYHFQVCIMLFQTAVNQTGIISSGTCIGARHDYQQIWGLLASKL